MLSAPGRVIAVPSSTVREAGALPHMRLLMDKQPVKSRKPFSFGISAEGRNLMNVFKQIRKGGGLKEYMLYHNQHKPLLTPKRPLFIRRSFPQRGENALC
jgi:hypothetical protein